MIFKHLWGVVKFKATGDNYIKFINSAKMCKIHLKNIVVENNKIIGLVYGIHFDKLKDIAKNNLMQIEHISKKGLVYKAKKYKLRFGLAFGGILSIAIILVLSNIVLKIRVTGCEGEVYENVLNSLSEYGLNAGKFIPSINFDEIELKLVKNVDNVSWASVRNSGGTIVINIHQSTEIPYMISKRLPCNIISTRDAQVVDFQVYSGQLMVLKGDGVKKGELLVSGFLLDEHQKPIYSHSRGKIIGEYTERISIFQPFDDVIKSTSNKEYKKKYLDFFDLKVPFGFGSKINGEYSENTYTNYLSFFSLKLPIGITQKTYKSIISEKIKYSKEEASKILYEKIEIYESNFLNSCEIIEKNVEEIEKKDGILVEVIYKVRGDIAKESKILIKD